MQSYYKMLFCSARFSAAKPDPPRLYVPPTCFVAHKTDCLKLYRPPTHLTAVKTDPPSISTPPTRFVAVKTDSPNIYWRQTNPINRASTGTLHALLQSKLTPQACMAPYMLCSCQNRLSERFVC